MLIFILVSVGATLIVTQSYLFKPLRQYAELKAIQKGIYYELSKRHITLWLYFDKFISCSQCFGFWMGIVVSTFINPIYYELTPIVFTQYDTLFIIVSMFMCGCISSLLSYITSLFTQLLCKMIESYEIE